MAGSGKFKGHYLELYQPLSSRRQTSKTYKYQKLQRSDSQIRILRLLPQDEIGIIRCTLQTCSLDDKPFYIALSYEWGEHDLETEVEILIDGKRSAVSHNLWLFLDYLCQSHKNDIDTDQLRLWVDAVCINQDDLDEKMTQVHLMGRIFDQAYHVLAWLGWTTTINTKTIFEYIKALASHANTNGGSEAAIYRGLIPDAHQTSSLDQMDVISVWKAIVRFCNLDYWSRRWIVQEVLFAKHLTIMCDGCELTWTNLHLALDFFVSHLNNQQQQGHYQTNVPHALSFAEVSTQLKNTTLWTIYKYRSRSRLDKSGNIPCLQVLMTDFHRTSCHVQHDLVFALLNLSQERETMSVDYTCSLYELFHKILLHVSKKHDWQWPVNFMKQIGISKDHRIVFFDAPEPRLEIHNSAIIIYHALNQPETKISPYSAMVAAAENCFDKSLKQFRDLHDLVVAGHPTIDVSDSQDLSFLSNMNGVHLVGQGDKAPYNTVYNGVTKSRATQSSDFLGFYPSQVRNATLIILASERFPGLIGNRRIGHVDVQVGTTKYHLIFRVYSEDHISDKEIWEPIGPATLVRDTWADSSSQKLNRILLGRIFWKTSDSISNQDHFERLTSFIRADFLLQAIQQGFWAAC